jgi:hypothetical protein
VLQRPVSVCPAGSAEVSGGDGDGSWVRASCALCPAGEFSGAPGAVACTPCELGYFSLPDGTACAPCDAGDYLDGETGACKPCKPGSYSSQQGAYVCQPVASGFVATADRTGQLPCPDGTYMNGTDCAPCPAGQFSGSPGAVVCTPCELGYFSLPDGTACAPCDAGEYLDAATGACTACAPGSYTSQPGAYVCKPVDSGFVATADRTGQLPCPEGSFMNGIACVPCAPGTFAATTGAVQCPSCPPATIAPAAGSAACTACPADSRDGEGRTACVCVPGFYDTNLGADSAAPACAPCVDGGACVGGRLLAQEGFWRESPTDDLFLKCREGYCLPEGGEAPPARRRLAQAAEQAAHCADGHSGVLCAICMDGYTMQGGFCQPCEEAAAWRSWSRASRGVTIAFFVPAGALLLTLLLLLPLLPGWERALWRCTTALAAAAEAVLGCMGALRRCCCKADDELPPPRRSSVRMSVARRSTARRSAFAVARASVADGAAAAAPAGDAGAEDVEIGTGSIDALLEAAAALLVALTRPGKILIKCVVVARAICILAPR